MSNTAQVSPYEESAPGRAAIGEVIDLVVRAFAQTDAERETVARYRELARQDRLAAARLSGGFATTGELARAAARLGFRPAHMSGKTKFDPVRPIELRAADGSALLIHRAKAGLSVVSTGDRLPISNLVRAVTIERVERHLAKSSKGSVTQRLLPSGEVEFATQKPGPSEPRRPQVTAVVSGDGSINVDISGTCGGECVGMVDALANAVGGTVTDRKIKPDYYASPVAPGESVRI